MATDALWVKKRSAYITTPDHNALYGYMKIVADPYASSTESSKRIDVFTEGDPDTSQTPSVLGRRSNIDDILIPATALTAQCEKV